MKKTWDIVIAGAGAAGCSLALHAARAGLKVLLIDRDRRRDLGRDLVVDVERTAFEEAGVGFPRADETPFEVKAFHLTTPEDRDTAVLRDLPNLSILYRRYVRRLLGEAIKAGAEFREGTEALEPVIEGSRAVGVKAKGSKGTEVLRASVVADATGMPAVLNRRAPASFGMEPDLTLDEVVVAWLNLSALKRAQAARYLSHKRMAADETYAAVALHGTYSTKLAVISLEHDAAYVMAGLKRGRGLPTPKEVVERHCDETGCFGRPRIRNGGAIPIRRAMDVLVADGYLTLGDAARQVNPMHGSGVASGLIAGRLASEAVVSALESGGPTREKLWRYAADYQRGRGAVLAGYDAFRRSADRLSRSTADRILFQFTAADEVYAGLASRLPVPGLAGLSQKAMAGLVHPWAFSKAGSAAIATAAAFGVYAAYPRTCSRSAMEKWRRAARLVFDRLGG